jgi:hypothetical protein
MLAICVASRTVRDGPKPQIRAIDEAILVLPANLSNV